MAWKGDIFAEVEARMLQVLNSEDTLKTNAAAARSHSAHPSCAELELGAPFDPRQDLSALGPQLAEALVTDLKAAETQSCSVQQQSMPVAPLPLSKLGTVESTTGHGTTVEGPCFLKMLVPDYVAGAIIGKKGATISCVERCSQCQVRVSSTGTFFPGTRERILVAGGAIKGLERCVDLLFEQLFLLRGEGEAMAKLVVPNSSVSAVIGSSGRTVRNLAQRTGCRINATPRVPPLLERLVVLSGMREPLLRATLEVCRSVQGDPHLCEHLCVAYNVELPLGTWLGESGLPKDPEVVLVHPGDAQGCSKRELLQYLLRAAPRELLVEQGIGGKAGNVLKSKSVKKLLELVETTWRAREAKGPARSPQAMLRPENS